MRFIGEPLQRIAEDHLRILRYFRFHARYGHGEPDADALDACTARANDLMALSRERIADELLKLLALHDPTPTVAMMLERGILPRAAGNRAGAAAARRALLAAERAAGIAPDPIRRLAALLPPDPTPAEESPPGSSFEQGEQAPGQRRRSDLEPSPRSPIASAPSARSTGCCWPAIPPKLPVPGQLDRRRACRSVVAT